MLALVERTRSDDRTPQNLISGATSWSQAALRPYSWRFLARRSLRFGNSGRLVCDAASWRKSWSQCLSRLNAADWTSQNFRGGLKSSDRN